MWHFSSEKININALDESFNYRTTNSSDSRFEWREGNIVDGGFSWDYSYTTTDRYHDEVCDIVTYGVQGNPNFHAWLNKAKRIIEDVYMEYTIWEDLNAKRETEEVSLDVSGIPDSYDSDFGYTLNTSVRISFNVRHKELEKKIVKRLREIIV